MKHLNTNNTDEAKDLLPIDWKMCLDSANKQESLAKELLNMLIEELPVSRQKIIDALDAYNMLDICKHVHKLKGATCYCGVPQMKASIYTIEAAIKSGDETTIRSTIKTLLTAIDAVIAYYHADSYQEH